MTTVETEQDRNERADEAEALLSAVDTIKATGGAVEIAGVRIEPCDEYGQTETDPHQWPAEAESILRDAHGAIYGDREADYGSPRTNMTRTAVVWQGLLLHKLADGAFIEPEDVVRCMVGVKLARDVNAPKRDNRVDGAGYFALLDRLETGQ